jgi:hypothetical protein
MVRLQKGAAAALLPRRAAATDLWAQRLPKHNLVWRTQVAVEEVVRTLRVDIRERRVVLAS